MYTAIYVYVKGSQAAVPLHDEMSPDDRYAYGASPYPSLSEQSRATYSSFTVRKHEHPFASDGPDAGSS